MRRDYPLREVRLRAPTFGRTIAGMMRSFGTVALLALTSCGGKAVIDAPLGAGGASASVVTTTTDGPSTNTGNPSGGAPDCRQTSCMAGLVCHIPTGVCITACDTAQPNCGSDACDPCATPSCPTCKDCVAGCLPSKATLCLDHADCPATDYCVYSKNLCEQRCGTGDPADVCMTGVCLQCITSSCFGCDDCLSTCSKPSSNG